jgi:outer membrane protein OmpA-like peptidoglycan-associated protein
MKTFYLIIGLFFACGPNTFAQGPASSSIDNPPNTPDQIHFTVEKSALSSDEYTDFGTYVNNGKLYFLSDRKSWPVSWTDSNEQHFLDLFVLDVKTGGKPEFAGNQINGKLNEGPICFSKDGTRVYFTRDYDAKKGERGEDGMIHLAVYTAKIKAGNWVDEKLISVNNVNYSVGHPVLSNNGKYLYFSSNRPGGKGGSDIYRAKVLEGGDVGSVELIPGEINTPGNELFPSIGSNDELYFSSTAHGGFGGLDIFMALYKGDEFTRVVNVGYPINSINDDFAYSPPNASNKGFFSTNRDGGDDIYSYDQVIPFRFVPLLSGELTLEDVQEKGGIIVEVMDVNENVISSQVTDIKGIYSFDLEEEKQYLVRFSKEGYDPVVEKVSTKGNGFGLNSDIVLKKDIGVVISLDLFALKTGLLVEGATVTMFDNINNKVFLSDLSDPSGRVAEPMIDLKEGDSLDLSIKIAKEGYLTKEVRYRGVLEEAMKDISLDEIYGNAVKMNRVGIALGIDVADMIDIESLYFVPDDFSILLSASRELDKVVAFMNENPEISIALRNHTDSRGGTSDNLTLSSKRAKSAMDYIVSKGISDRRLSGRGFGEKELLNRCADGIDCSDGEHLENCRTQYIITKN